MLNGSANFFQFLKKKLPSPQNKNKGQFRKKISGNIFIKFKVVVLEIF